MKRAAQTTAGLCINCDNRHGCRTPQPPCHRLSAAPEERHLAGRALMTRHGLLHRCRSCGHFRQCWRPEDYWRQNNA